MTTKSKCIIFRVQGHGPQAQRSLERCMILAENQLRRGGQAHIAIDRDAHALRERLAASDMSEITLDGPVASDEELAQLECAITNTGASSIVVDGPFDTEYLRKLAAMIYVAVIDDDACRTLPVQLIINPGIAADERFYTCRADSTLLLGPAFAMIDPQISDWPRPERERGRSLRILVDANDEQMVARMLSCMPAATETTVLTIVAGTDSSELAQASLAACARSYVVERISRDMLSDTILFCDGAIVGTGCNASLLSYWGIPTLSLAQNQQHQRESERLAEEGANMQVPAMSKSSDAELQSQLESFLCDEALRHRLGKRMAALVDGRGANRVLDALESTRASKARILKAA